MIFSCTSFEVKYDRLEIEFRSGNSSDEGASDSKCQLD